MTAPEESLTIPAMALALCACAAAGSHARPRNETATNPTRRVLISGPPFTAVKAMNRHRSEAASQWPI
jgi:hypothetical protein